MFYSVGPRSPFGCLLIWCNINLWSEKFRRGPDDKAKESEAWKRKGQGLCANREKLGETMDVDHSISRPHVNLFVLQTLKLMIVTPQTCAN